MKVRFTLSNLNSQQEITEPGGWTDHEISLERHPEFCSLIESISSLDKFVFYGNDDEHGDGGIDFIRTIENGGAFDEKIEMLIEFSRDNINYDEYFRGMLQLEDMEELPENELEVPIVREDDWSRFVSRLETPVDVTSSVDLDGNAVDPLEPVTLNLTSQIIEKKFDGHLLDTRTFNESELSTNDYIQIDVDHYVISEIKEKHTLGILTNPEVPVGVISAEDDGEYTFDLRVEVSIVYYDVVGEYPDCAMDRTVDAAGDYLNLYIQINNDAAEAFTETTSPLILENVSTIYTYSGSKTLKKGDQIRIYGDVVGDISEKGNAGATLWIHSVNGIGEILVPILTIDPLLEVCTFLPAEEATDVTISAPSLVEIPTYFRITAATTYPETQVEGFWLHDLFAGIIDRIAPGFGFYSEVLGSTFTKVRQYNEDGCFSNFVCVKGVHLRGYRLTDDEDDPVQRYTLQQKPFSISFKECWDGANPIFNLGLGYETLADSPEAKIIRIENKAHFYNDTSTSADFSNVYNIRRTFDKDYIFKKVTIGYNKWESESYSGIDDPQTKRTYSTGLSAPGQKGKSDKTVLSGFIAASLAIETTRRMTVEKSSDYRYDNDTFIIAANTDEAPETYNPELDENFVSVTNLLYSESRYNLILTPLRNLLRWGNYLTGCLQSYLDRPIKFTTGEGNFYMQSEYDCDFGKVCQAVICDELTESQDIDIEGYVDDFGFLHLPLLYLISIPMEWDEYKTIRSNPKRPIGISQTDSGHKKFFIKSLKYNPMTGEATIQAWPKEYLEIKQIEYTPKMTC